MKKLLASLLFVFVVCAQATTQFKNMDCLELREACCSLKNDSCSWVKASAVMWEAHFNNQSEILECQKEILARLPR